MLLPVARVRGLPATLDDIIVNSSEGGVWSVAPTMLGDARFRVVNNTAVRPPFARACPAPPKRLLGVQPRARCHMHPLIAHS